MSTARALYPRLLRLGDRPAIVGHRCRSCGRVAFPPDPYACEQCGADISELDEIELAAEGRIHAVATVHRHHRPEPPTPFTVATIVLDDGVSLKGVLKGQTGATVGSRVRGVTVPAGEDDDGVGLVDLRFEVVGPDGGEKD